MLGLLPQPKIQAAEATIITLCDRLAHSTMLEDRRAAMLSLKGFAHDKRELVASNGLKGLINSLKQDKADPETVRACLETLIILFVKASSIDSDLAELSRRARQKNKRYVSPLIVSKKIQSDVVKGPVDDISLWLTDEFTHDDENVVALLDFIQSSDMFTSLYALQLLSAMVTNRPDTVKQSLFSVHHGISTLVAALESKYEMVRDETVLLLLNLTDNHLEFQKLVAFEGAFDKLFSIIDDQGGICYGGVTVENCLSLLSNLLQYNVSNQKLFSGTQGISKYATMLDTGDETNWGEQATTNMTSALQLARIFVIPGGESTRLHQDSFAQSGVLLTVLKLAFGPATSLPIRTAALLTAASLIYENHGRQDELLNIEVPYYDLSLSLNIQMTPKIVPVAQALLNWALLLPSNYLFTLRAASQFCLSAAFEGNAPAALQFIDELAAGLKGTESSEMANLFQTLGEYNEDLKLNPFKVWFAAVIVMHLLTVSNDVKDHLRKVTIGDAELGQDELCIIQAISSQLLSSLDNEDPTVSLAYLMLLSVWLFDDLMAVNDFVSERSNVQQLIMYVTTNNGGSGNVLVGSLATILLGIAYDFTSADSPIPRTEFYHLLTNTLGRDQYTLSFQRFRENAEFKEFDPSLIFGAPKGANGLPRVYFDRHFVGLVRDNINRIQRAIDKDPSVAPSSRVSLDMYEELKVQLLAQERELQELERAKAEEQKVLLAKEAELQMALAAATDSLKALQGSHEGVSGSYKSLQASQALLTSELATLRTEHTDLVSLHKSKVELLATTTRKLEELEAQHAKTVQQMAQLTAAKEKAEDGINKVTRELFLLNKNGGDKEVKNLRTQLEAATKQEQSTKSRLKELEAALKTERGNAAQLQSTNEKLINKLKETAQVLTDGEQTEAALRQRIQELENAKAEADAAKHRIASLERENKLIRAKLGGHEPAVEPVITLLEDRVRSLEAQLALAKAELDTESSLEEDLEEANRQRDELAARLAESESKISQFQQETSVLYEAKPEEAKPEEMGNGVANGLDDLKSELAAKDAQLKELEAKHAEPKTVPALDLAKTQLNEIQGEVQAAKAELETVRASLHRACSDLETAKAGPDTALAAAEALAARYRTEAELAKAELEMARGETSLDESELQAQLETFKANALAKASQDADDIAALMLLVEHALDRNAHYKSRLQALHENVSDSEDEESESLL